jgi:hypothetical protein
MSRVSLVGNKQVMLFFTGSYAYNLNTHEPTKYKKMTAALKRLNEKVSEYCICYMCIIIASAKFTNHGLQLLIWRIRKFREGTKKWMAHAMFISQVFNTTLLIKLYVLHQLTQSIANLMKHLRMPIKKYTQKSN